METTILYSGIYGIILGCSLEVAPKISSTYPNHVYIKDVSHKWLCNGSYRAGNDSSIHSVDLVSKVRVWGQRVVWSRSKSMLGIAYLAQAQCAGCHYRPELWCCTDTCQGPLWHGV